MAVAYRYRTCAEHNDEFRALLRGASDLWREWGVDEEQNYKLERCLYGFFTNGLSVFESLGYCLYFVGAALQPGDFPDVSRPRNINLKQTADAFKIAFAHVSVTTLLAVLAHEPHFKRLSDIRNALAHRLGGRRGIQETTVIHEDSTSNHTRKEIWYIPGLIDSMPFDEEMTQRCLGGITRLLNSLVEASVEFIQVVKHSQTSMS